MCWKPKILFSVAVSLMAIWINPGQTAKKIKYEICSNSSPQIDSSITSLKTNAVYLIADEMVYKLQIKGEEKAKIEDMHSVYDWSEQIEPPIDIIKTDDFNMDIISLINCEIGTEWSVKYEESLYMGSKQTDSNLNCKLTFEFLAGKESRLERASSFYFLEYDQDGKEIFDRFRQKYLRSNDSTDNSPSKFIRWVSTFEEQTISAPFTTLNGQRITAAFIHDFHWYLFGGRYYCRVKFINGFTFEECKPLLIIDWIQNCDEEVEEKVNQDNKPGISVSLIVLVVIIVVAIIIILVVVFLIVKEVTKKSSNPVNQQSSGVSSR